MKKKILLSVFVLLLLAASSICIYIFDDYSHRNNIIFYGGTILTMDDKTPIVEAMFIKDGKSIFGNVGLLISLIILAIMLFFSYNRCIAPFENSVATTTTRALGEMRFASEMTLRQRLSAFSVTEQVFITAMSQAWPKGTVSKPASSRIRLSWLVSEKLSLQPNV
jgi:hypothetical protein